MPLGAWRLNSLAKPQVAAGTFLDGVHFIDGSADGYRDLTIDSNNVTDSEFLTISFWIKDGSDNTRFFELGTGSATADILLDTNSTVTNGAVRFTERNLGSLQRMSSSVNITDGSWHHVLILWNSSNADSCKFYIDGVEDTSRVINNRTAGEVINISSATKIGFGYPTDESSTGWSGEMAQFWLDNTYVPDVASFYDTENDKAVLLGSDGTATGLTQPLIFHDGDLTGFATLKGDTSKISYTLATEGDVESSPEGPSSNESYTAPRPEVYVIANGDAQIDTAQSKFGGASGLFDGTGDYLKCYPQDVAGFGTGNFTMEGWFRLGATGIVQYIFDARSVAGSAENAMTWQVRTDNKIYLYINGAYRIVSTSTLSSGTWYHIAIVRNGGTMTLYLDGSSEGTWTGISAVSFVGRQMLFGTYHGANAAWYNGHMDEIRFSDTARYTTTFTPSTSAFTNDANTLLLMHMDGSDASTSFIDDNG